MATAIIDVQVSASSVSGPRIRRRRSGDDADQRERLSQRRAVPGESFPGIAIVFSVLGFT